MGPVRHRAGLLQSNRHRHRSTGEDDGWPQTLVYVILQCESQRIVWAQCCRPRQWVLAQFSDVHTVSVMLLNRRSGFTSCSCVWLSHCLEKLQEILLWLHIALRSVLSRVQEESHWYTCSHRCNSSVPITPFPQPGTRLDSEWTLMVTERGSEQVVCLYGIHT